MLLMASFPPPMMNNPSYDRERGRSSSSSSSSYSANINPPNAGNGAANFARNGNANDNLDGGGVDANGVDGREVGAGRPRGGGGLGAIASGAASNERYNRDDVRRRQQQRGGGMGGGQSPGRGGGDGYYSSSNAGPTPRVGGPGYGPRAGPGSVGGGGIGGGDTFETDMRRRVMERGGDGPPPLPMRPPGGGGGGDNDPRINPNLRYEESDYSEYVKRLRRTSGVVGPPGPPPPPPPGGGMRDLEEEVVRLRTENALLKRSCQDMMNNFNELSNRLFDVDECLKKVAKVFPSEDEMESLEWLMRR